MGSDTCYGGGLASIPAYIGDLFGTRQLGAIHGYILTAWVRETTKSYTVTISVFAAMFMVALLISLLIRVDIKKLKEEATQKEKSVELAS